MQRPIPHLIALVALVAALLVPSAAGTLTTAAADTCTPTTEVPAISITKDGAPVTTEEPVTAWSLLEVGFSYSLEDGHCAGQQYTIAVPPQLGFETGTTWDLKDENGTTAATMTYTGGALVVTLTSYVESHQDVTLNGWVQAQINSTITPGETADLEFTATGTTITVPVPVGVCGPDCESMPSTAGKWGNPGALNEDGTRSGSVTIQFPTLTSEMAGGAASQEVSWTDTLTSEDQAFDCDASGAGASGTAYTGRNQWGDSIGGTTTTVTVDSCTPTKITGTVTIPVNQFAEVRIPVTFTGGGPWTDDASMTFNGAQITATTSVTLRSGGGSANGRVPATPTPSATVSAVASPSATPSATPSLTPSATPSATVSAVASPSPATTVGTSPATTTAPTQPTSPSLARTGTDGVALMTAAGALLLLGGIALRRARAHQ